MAAAMTTPAVPQPTVTLIVGEETRKITPTVGSISFTTLAVGGFGYCTFDLGGWRTRDEIPYLATVQIVLGDFIIWEGRVEDLRWSVTGETKTTVTCLGFRRLLEDDEFRGSFNKRDIELVIAGVGEGGVLGSAAWGGSNAGLNTKDILMTLGRFDAANPTRSGVQWTGAGTQIDVGQFGAVDFVVTAPDSEFCFRRASFDATYTGSNVGDGTGTHKLSLQTGVVFGGGGIATSLIRWIPSGGGAGPIWAEYDYSALGEPVAGFRILCGTDPNSLNSSWTPAKTDILQVSNIRVAYLSRAIRLDAFKNVPEDDTTNGGYYGGTILRALLSLDPRIVAGVIEAGSDFTIQQLERFTRDTYLSVVNEVASYYTREWAVWEGKRFDWRTVNLDEPQVVISQEAFTEITLDSSVDGISSTAYISYTDAASQLPAEARATSSDPRNPFVAGGRGAVTQADVPMVTGSAQQLANLTAQQNGQYPTITGQVVLPAGLTVDTPLGRMPAYAIRAGWNLLIPDLPKLDPLVAGRDGQTLFHIVSTEANLGQGTITLELDGYTRTLDTLMARLAAVTRTVTG